METILNLAQVIAPIFAAIALGVLARRKSLLSASEVRGLQQFAIQFGLPCVVFTSCLTADMGLESLKLHGADPDPRPDSDLLVLRRQKEAVPLP